MENQRRNSFLRQFWATIVVTSGVFGLGTVLGWTSTSFPDMINESNGHFSNVTEEQKSWIGSSATLGALAASPIAGIGIGKIGRKNTMLFNSIPFSLGWILIGFSSNMLMMCGGRFLCGFCGGIFSLSSPVYMGEIAESRIRGALMSAFQLMLVGGILFTYVVGMFVSWKALALICSLIPLFFVAASMSIPETPLFLLSQGKLRESYKALGWLRGAEENIDMINDEFTLLQQMVDENARESFRVMDLFTPTILKPLSISLCLMILEQISAFNVVIFYCVEIFAAAGTSMDAHLASVTVAVVQVIATIISTALVDRAGRRPLLIFSEAVMGISFLGLGTFFYLKLEKETTYGGFLTYISWLPLASLLLFIIAFSIGIGPLSWTIMGEILPSKAKGTCSAIATTVVWLSAFVITKIYQPLTLALGIYWSFWIFASFSLIGTLLVYLFVLETKGKTLEEIQAHFTKKTKDLQNSGNDKSPHF